MTQSNRQKLKNFFHNKSQLSAAHFSELIDAALIRVDDRFHGLWREGQVYRKGDVVLFQRQLWEMAGEGEICAKPGDEPSEKRPEIWQSFIDDNDWAVLTDEGIMWAKVFDKIGIGVGFDENDMPEARLDIRKLAIEPPEAYRPKPETPEETEPVKDDSVTEDSVIEDSVIDDSVTGESVTAESGSVEAVTGESVVVGSITGESVIDDSVTTESVADDSVTDRLESETPDINETSSKTTEPETTGTGRWLLFPAAVSRTQQTFLHYGLDTEEQSADQGPDQTTALITDLSFSAATWWSNATDGFAFRHSPTLLTEAAALQSSAMSGQVMLAVRPQPDPVQGARLGLNVAEPTALFEAIAPQKGYFTLLPETETAPTLTLLNLTPTDNAAYFSAAITHQETAWKTNAEAGFVFSNSDDDDALATSLMRIRQHSQGTQSQVGIGIDSPQASLDIQGGTHTQIQLIPTVEMGPKLEPLSLPTISVMQQPPEETARYLHAGLGEAVAGWVTNAPNGFALRQKRDTFPNSGDSSPPTIDQGHIHLSIREDGRMGIGTDAPNATLEITSEAQAGRLLFSPSPYGTAADSPALTLLNHAAAALEGTDEEQSDIYFTLGTQASQSVLVTNAEEGFTFKAGANPKSDDNGWLIPERDRPDADLLDTNGGQLLVNISPEGSGRVGIGKRPDAYALDVQGIVQGLTFYQAHHAEWMENTAPLEAALEKIQTLQPITFDWNRASGAADAGRQIGLQAEALREVFPLVVNANDDAQLSVAYQNLVPVLIQAINELSEKNQKEHDYLEKYMGNLADRFSALTIGVLLGWILIALLGQWG